MATATTTTTTTTVLSMKLLIDAKAQRVLFAEAGKDVVDFLFSLLALPVSTVVKLVGKDSIVGSVGNLYASVEELEDTYVLQGVAKSTLLSPAVSSSSSSSSLLCLPEPSPGPAHTVYRCTNNGSSNCRTYVTDECGKACPQCRCSMTKGVTYFSSPEPSSGQPKTLYICTSNYTSNCNTDVTDVYNKTCPYCGKLMTTVARYLSGGEPAASVGKGFVQGIVTYTVMDNLMVKPMSAISSITLLNTLAVTDIAALQEKTVQVGYNEGLAILKASLQSKTVLTDVFLGNKKRPCVVDINNVD